MGPLAERRADPPTQVPRERIPRVRHVEHHFECHCILKIGKRAQKDANADRNRQTRNLCGSEAYAGNPRIHWIYRKRLPGLPLSPPPLF